MARVTAEIIDLNNLKIQDCASCCNPKKWVSSRTMDLEEEGTPGVLYLCDNMKCKETKREISHFLLRRSMYAKDDNDELCWRL